MNLQELNNFLSLAQHLHFGKASQACHLSPSALTRSIQRLEDSVGETLFLRDNRSVSLTPFGEKFRSYASNTIREWENFKQEIKNSDTVAGHLSIYSSVTAVYSILPNLLEKYREFYPEVQLELRTGSAEDSIEQVIEGEIDLSVAALPDQQYPQLEFLPLIQTDLVFVGLKNDDSIPFKNNQLDPASAQLVTPRSGLSRNRLEQWFKKHQLTPNIKTEVTGNEGILAMVRLGCGIGIVPEQVLKRSPFHDDLQIIPSPIKLKPYTVGLCTTRRNLIRPNVKALWEMVDV